MNSEEKNVITSFDERMFTSDEVAAKNRMTVGAFHNLRHRGHGPRGIRVGKRVLFSEREVVAWMNSRVDTAGHAAVATAGPRTDRRAS